ncbi:HCOMODA/2-hydroxy-3-carboxy-muconic semialdehyde decarboxylase [Paraburkholderia steynii]|uniref:HCOMODA/2-hydroxy-3-carboxy-muconic semialdehyde decarboxylase n=1 Tax=Paraburkholderia steynii TaxID=1245441 RepID=A0A7Z7B240_9BURK|nr:class II aldolase/adducin family protein [Paraburkholderia steynii]SDH25112.1 HCOMODA/2-hydroxy-3-carboxy-muconic semialdehyde decarboxylase [Paraburkholderia steynii]
MSENVHSDLNRKLRVAARSLGRAGLAHAYGHYSVRLDANHFLVCAPKPMTLLESSDEGTVVPVTGALPDGVLGEVRIHQQIYSQRPDIRSVARSMPPKVMSLSTLSLTPEPRHGFGSYFAPFVPLWDDPLLIRSDEQASALVQVMGKSRAVVMRGNGAVVAGSSPEEVLVLTWYLEDAARVELDVLGCGAARPGKTLTQTQCETRATFSGRILERMWDYLSAGDCEL